MKKKTAIILGAIAILLASILIGSINRRSDPKLQLPNMESKSQTHSNQRKESKSVDPIVPQQAYTEAQQAYKNYLKALPEICRRAARSNPDAMIVACKKFIADPQTPPEAKKIFEEAISYAERQKERSGSSSPTSGKNSP